MKYYCTNILICTAALIAAWACTKPDPTQTALPDAPITLSATSPDTKAMLTGDTFKAKGNRIQVYDFVTNGNTTTKHIDSYAGPDVTSNSPLHVEGTTWPFTDEIDGTTADVKQWIPGTHKFFGWLAKDISSGTNLTPEGLFGSSFSFDEDTQILTIPSTTMTASSPQFDFMYSNIYTTEPINEPVDLEFSHLFTAISFGFVNNSSNTVTVSNLDVKMYTNQTATVDFSTDAVEVEFDGRTTLGYFYGNGGDSFTDVTVPAKTTTNGVTTPGTVTYAFDFSATEPNYLLSWPMSEDLDECTIEIRFKYNANGENYQSQSLKFPTGTLLPGKKYHFNISFADKAPIKINYLVVDWSKINNDVTFE